MRSWRMACSAWLVLATACSGAPLNYMVAHGPAAASEARLGWYLVIVSCIVVAIVALLVVIGGMHRPAARDPNSLERTAGHSGLLWIYLGGLLIPAVILVVSFALTLGTLHATARPGRDPAATIQIIGHRWWWEVRYLDPDPAKTIETANEIHVPVGEPVRLQLTSADVIHSFWVPQLAGKTDVIPGQVNETWLEAHEPGTSRGMCGEYCGLQHANMMLTVVAESPAAFARWAEGQRQPAAVPAAAPAQAGQAVFTTSACALCHTVRGTGAGGLLGPDLTHLASRGTIAAGVLPNRRGQLAGWVANPQAIKPGVLMPSVPLSSTDLNALLAYLESLH